MNRIRKHKGFYQVLITPNIKISPDSSIMIGNWEDSELSGFSIMEFETLGDAQVEAFLYPDIDWYRIVLNHKYIYIRLRDVLSQIISDNNYKVQLYSKLMSPNEFKNAMFDRIIHNNNHFNLRYDFSDIISFTIVNMWSSNLQKLSKTIEQHREHLVRNDLRIKHKKIIDNKIICLLGSTEFGTTYTVKLLPTLLHQWATWHKEIGHIKKQQSADLYKQYLQSQEQIDLGKTLR